MGFPAGFPLSDRDRLFRTAQYKVKAAISRGELKPAKECTCVDCGAPGWCYDHRDYNYPLSVQPVCRACNLRRGPGLPLPIEEDGRDRKNGLDGGSSGTRWSAMEGGGEGFDPLQSKLSTEIDFGAIEVMADNARDFHSVIKHVELKAVGKRLSKKFVGQARADWFKARDPWYA